MTLTLPPRETLAVEFKSDHRPFISYGLMWTDLYFHRPLDIE